MNLLIQSSLGLFTKGTNHKSDKYLKLYFILKGQKTLLSRVSFLITNFIISHQKNNSASNEYDTQKLVDGKDFKNISGINESNSSSSNLKTVNIEGNALQSNIEAIRDDMCAINSEVVLRLKSFNDCLCQCKFGNLLTTSDEIIEAIHNILLTYQLDEEVEKLAKKQLNSIVQITKTLSSFIVQSNEDLNLSSNNLTFIPSFDGCRRRPIGRRRSSNSDIDEEVNHTNPSPLNPNINPNSYINNNSEEIVICRICDEQIPVELFEEHTESCISAYQSETILSEINDALLEIEQGLIDQYLNVEWPDVQKNAISMTMPIEHFNLILHRAILIDPHGADAPEELQSLIYEIDSISHMMENKVITVEGMKIKTALTEKKHASFAFRKEREILKKTRISGSDQTISQAAISDFDIIKRISSGAYARVFLVRKKKTGDIYALKVLPKADVSQKNQVKRILAEKDILLQFNNPYIINFCMFPWKFGIHNHFHMIFTNIHIISSFSKAIE
ncbi:hypothetical protein TRFO_29514 [Tritrichomonas foetus]|uniref:non-specific serine/threonine protein kinase n=1 Tax=Tritrichomonas foetus TaxID=1144522 RepID=A0A1J4JW17_9EUKA|nr:hypothetical protein TRFO_29514 [Tritrichomonas foetus]|eukprot:OHT03203.1 hypothetical protein TRFO_29514 [Tritrichomonas foetus]